MFVRLIGEKYAAQISSHRELAKWRVGEVKGRDEELAKRKRRQRFAIVTADIVHGNRGVLYTAVWPHCFTA